MKKSFLFATGVKELDFDELRDEFQLSIYSETNKITKLYGSLFDRDEIEQQCLLELWEAFKKYDISRGMLVSTYIYHRFRNVKTVLFNNKISTKDNEFYNQQASLNQQFGEEEDGEFINSSFENDDNYNLNNYNTCPEQVVERNSVYDTLIEAVNNESEMDLFIILSDRTEYPVSLYAEKHGISVRGAYKRLDKFTEYIKDVYEEAFSFA